MEIEEVAFDVIRVLNKRGAISDIRDRVEAFFSHPNSSDVHAIARNEFFVPAQINGGNCVL